MKFTKQHLLTIAVITASTVCVTLFLAGSTKALPKIVYKEVTIHECEYIYVDDSFGDSRVYSITHKGNCRNAIHQCN